MSSRGTRKQAARVVREQRARQQRRRRARWVTVGAVAVLLLFGLTGYVVYAAQRPDGDFPVPAAATDDRAGTKVGDGPVTVEVYLDYLCPACRAFEQAARSTLDEYLSGHRITLVYHPVAILDRYSTNRYSSRAAAGAGCAADAGRIVAYSTALFADQPAEGGPGHGDDKLIELAAGAGVPREEFGQCLREGRYADWVDHVTDQMAAKGHTGTPTVVVNGTRLTNPTPQALSAAIDAVTPK